MGGVLRLEVGEARLAQHLEPYLKNGVVFLIEVTRADSRSFESCQAAS